MISIKKLGNGMITDCVIKMSLLLMGDVNSPTLNTTVCKVILNYGT